MAFGKKKKSNWDRLSARTPDQTTKFHDVYADQQLERSTITSRVSMKGRTIFVAVVSVMMFLIVYFCLSFAQYAANTVFGSVQTAPADDIMSQVEEVLDDTKVGSPETAPQDITLEDFVAEYFTPIESESSVQEYADVDGKTYVMADIQALWNEVQAGQHLTEEAKLWQTVNYLRENNEYGLIPISLAPINITRSDFESLYFARIESNSLVGAFVDYNGTRYTEFQVDDLYAQVQTGEAGSGELSTFVGVGGNDNMSAGGEVVEEEAVVPFSYFLRPSLGKILVSLFFAGMVWLILYPLMRRNRNAQDAENSVDDINQYQNDQHIALPEEVMQKFDWFPDVGARCGVQVSSMISHVMLMNKGLNKVKSPRRADKDIRDSDGDVEYYKGEILLDDDGHPIVDVLPAIDEAFGEALFDASGLPKDSKKTPKEQRLRKRYDATRIPYNPKNENRNKLKNYDTVADMINGDWELPEYEPQRPAGAYLVDTEPVNTMVLAITRAGKGQTVIEPTIDMWTREKESNNMVINDPKGELLVKFYVRTTVRGYQVVQFNLINPLKTDIYNPLGMAADAAREGDFTKCAQYVENIAEVFFPADGSDDPVWPNAANNAFKRAAYGLIDYYLEEEQELRLKAERTNMPPKVLEAQVDQLWGKVTLYNCYQLFVQLTAKKEKNPAVVFRKKAEAGDFDLGHVDKKTGEYIEPGKEALTEEEYDQKLAEATKDSELWEDKPDADLLTLFFNATEALPTNQMRTLIANANNALRTMSGAEKMLSSVYGIAITAMSFFTDPTISTLTSGTPSQNTDLGGLSFPRRLGVRFNPEFVQRYHLTGLQCRWQAYSDAEFTDSLGKDFYHEDMVTREGWAMYYFKGKFKTDIGYIRLQIVNAQTSMLVRTFFFKFQKSYQMSLDARYYITDPVLGTKIVKNGILTELRPMKTREGKTVYRPAKLTFKQNKIKDVLKGGKVEEVQTPAIMRNQVRYSEQPKAVFLVTPPHLMKYAKLILILIKQLVDLNFDKSYMTKSWLTTLRIL